MVLNCVKLAKAPGSISSNSGKSLMVLDEQADKGDGGVHRVKESGMRLKGASKRYNGLLIVYLYTYKS